MKLLTYLFVISLFFNSCKKSEDQSTNLIANFGSQPAISTNLEDDIAVVFGDKESIYFSISKNQGLSFSEPSLVANLEGMMLGYSSGPGITITSTSMVVTAPDKAGNLYAWSRPINAETWSGPFRVNDVDKSVGELLSDITSTPDGTLFSVWIDTRILKSDSGIEHPVSKPEAHSKVSKQNKVQDLSKMTPIGMTIGELYEKIGDVPENAHLAFHNDNEGNLWWVFLDKNGKVLKAENMEEYKQFRERNKGQVRTKGKIYITSSLDGGKNWSESKMIYRSPDGSVCECCKPSIVSDSEGKLTVMFRNNIDGSRDLYFMKSSDGGKSFTQAEKLGSGTWKINGCPMDGGDLVVDKSGELNTIWQRKGEIFLANSSISEKKIGSGRSPSISTSNLLTYMVFSKGEDIMSVSPNNSVASKIGTGSSPKVVALKNGAIYFWVNSNGINFKKELL